MKITFQGQSPQALMPEAAPTAKHSTAKGTERTREQGGIITDISGIVKDNEIFAGQGRTARDVLQEAGQKDVSLTRDYLTVMSNILSENDMKSLIDGDMHPGQMPVEQTVTVVDRIKATLMEAGVHIAGYTDTLDDETLNAITKSQALSDQIRDSFSQAGVPLTGDTAKEAVEAWDKAESLTPLTDDCIKYMVENRMSPTIDELYSASHSGQYDTSRQGRGYYMEAGGYMSRKADSINFDSLQASIDSVLDKAGLSGDERARDAAKWLISNGIALTPESVTDYLKLKDTRLPPAADTAFDAMAAAVSDGKSPAAADLYDNRSLWEKAVDLFKSVFGLGGADVDEAVAAEKAQSAESAARAGLTGSDRDAATYEREAEAVTADYGSDGTYAPVSRLSLKRMIDAHNRRGRDKFLGDTVFDPGFRSKTSIFASAMPKEAVTDKGAGSADPEPKAAGEQQRDMVHILSGEGLRNTAEKAADPGEGHTPEGIRARRLLEEIRLVMTVEANRELIKSGFSIDTAPIEDAIEALKAAQKRIDSRIFGDHEFYLPADLHKEADRETAAGEDNTKASAGDAIQTRQITPAEVFSRTMTIAGSMPAMPVDLVGRADIEKDSLPALHLKGRSLQQAYQKAGEQYEALSTQVRRDLGDSIRQAFRNVDDILADKGLPLDEANRRALRILGYNRMELSDVNIAAIKEADQSIRSLIDRMTPGAVMRLIREGHNPLSMTVQELNEQLSGDRDRDESRDRYARFLYRLEKSKSVTPEEKESYIGIYRLIRQIEKSDGAVIGNLVNTGGELNFKNLLSALRSRKSTGMDFTVDDSTGLSGGVKPGEKTIEQQIFTAYDAAMERELYERITRAEATELSEIAGNTEAMLENYLWNRPLPPEDIAPEDNASDPYPERELSKARSLENVTDDDIGLLKLFDMPATTENLLAASSLRMDGSADLRRLRSLSRSEDFSDLKALADSLEDELESRDSALMAYDELITRAAELTDASIYDGADMTGSRVEELGLIYKQLYIVAGLTTREQYDIPVITDDDVFNLRLRLMGAEDEEDRGRIEASIDAGELGVLGFRLRILNGGVSGIFTADSPLGKSSLEAMSSALDEMLESMGYENTDIYTGVRSSGKPLQEPGLTDLEEGKRSTGTPELYRVAKALVKVLRSQIQNTSLTA